jgi:hypothetical protein
MESRKKLRQRIVTRCSQPSRIEDQLWTAAYEQIWPLVRQVLLHCREGQFQGRDRKMVTSPIVARRA